MLASVRRACVVLLCARCAVWCPGYFAVFFVRCARAFACVRDHAACSRVLPAGARCERRPAAHPRIRRRGVVRREQPHRQLHVRGRRGGPGGRGHGGRRRGAGRGRRRCRPRHRRCPGHRQGAHGAGPGLPPPAPSWVASDCWSRVLLATVTCDCCACAAGTAATAAVACCFCCCHCRLLLVAPVAASAVTALAC